MLTKLKNLFFPKLKQPENDLLKITSHERINGMDIFYGVCKKRVTLKDIRPLTEVIEKMYHADAYLTVDAEDLHKIKMVLKPR